MEFLDNFGDFFSWLGKIINDILGVLVDFINFISSIINFLIENLEILPAEYRGVLITVLTIASVVLIWRFLR